MTLFDYLFVGAVKQELSVERRDIQTPHNHGGVGSGYELVQKIKMGNYIRHAWVNIKCENE